MSLTIVISHSPVKVGVGFDHHIEPVCGLVCSPIALKNVRSIGMNKAKYFQRATLPSAWEGARERRRWPLDRSATEIGASGRPQNPANITLLGQNSTRMEW
jgi:hypothetical protein